MQQVRKKAASLVGRITLIRTHRNARQDVAVSQHAGELVEERGSGQGADASQSKEDGGGGSKALVCGHLKRRDRVSIGKTDPDVGVDARNSPTRRPT